MAFRPSEDITSLVDAVKKEPREEKRNNNKPTMASGVVTWSWEEYTRPICSNENSLQEKRHSTRYLHSSRLFKGTVFYAKHLL